MKINHLSFSTGTPCADQTPHLHEKGKRKNTGGIKTDSERSLFFHKKRLLSTTIRTEKKRLIDGIITRRRVVVQADNKDNFDLSKDKVSNKSVNASILHQRQPINEKNECIYLTH